MIQSTTENTPETKANQWDRASIQALFDLPLMDLMFEAQTVHRANHEPNKVQLTEHQNGCLSGRL